MSQAQILEQIQVFLQGLNPELEPAGEVITTVFQDLLDLDPLGFQARSVRYYTPAQCYLVFIHASLFQQSLHASVKTLTAANLRVPDAEALLDHLRATPLQDLVFQADRLYRHQWTHLAPEIRTFLENQLVISLDTVLHPYYGKVNKARVVGGKRKASTNYHHTYGSAQLLWEGHGQTVAVRMLAKGDGRGNWVSELLDQVELYGRPTVILGDGDFWVNELLWTWHHNHYCFVIRVGSGVKNAYEVQWLFQRVKETNSIQETCYQIFLNKPSRRFSVRFIAWPDSEGEIQCIGVPDFLADLPAEFFIQLIRSRFGIETGYRTWNEFLPPTSSRHPSIRYGLVMLAVCLYNSYSIGRTSPQLIAAPSSRNWKRLLTLLRSKPQHSSSVLPPAPFSLFRASAVIGRPQHSSSVLPPTPPKCPPKGTCQAGPLSTKFRRSYHFLPIQLIKMTWCLLISALSFASQQFFLFNCTREVTCY